MPLSCTLVELSTEVLVKILSYLPATDLLSIRRTCRIVRDIVAGTAYIQYILHLQINGVDDSFPSDYPYSERLELLRHHEKSWRSLQFSFRTKRVIHDHDPYPDRFTLQDCYLIYEEIIDGVLLYGYTDLCFTSPRKELEWVHITVDDSRFPTPSAVAFAVDHDLVIAVRFVSIPTPSSVQALPDESQQSIR
jgi:F-box domain